jgi:hypothetical protein
MSAATRSHNTDIITKINNVIIFTILYFLNKLLVWSYVMVKNFRPCSFPQTGVTEIRECKRVTFSHCISFDKHFLYRLWVLMADILSTLRNILTILDVCCVVVNELQTNYQNKIIVLLLFCNTPYISATVILGQEDLELVVRHVAQERIILVSDISLTA